MFILCYGLSEYRKVDMVTFIKKTEYFSDKNLVPHIWIVCFNQDKTANFRTIFKEIFA